MSIFGDVQKNIFNMNIKSFEKNILEINIESMNYTYEKKWIHDNKFKCPLLDLNYHPPLNSNNSLRFLTWVFKILYNDKNSSYYLISHKGVFKTKNFIDFKKITTIEQPENKNFGSSVSIYNGTIYCICFDSIISISKDDIVRKIVNQSSDYRSIFWNLGINNEDGSLFITDRTGAIYLKNMARIVKIYQFNGTINSLNIYKNNILFLADDGVYFSKDYGTSFSKIISPFTSNPDTIDDAVIYIDSSGIYIYYGQLNKFDLDGNRISSPIPMPDFLFNCKKFYFFNGIYYALCIGGVFKSSDWINWSKYEEFNSQFYQDYYAISMFIDNKYEVYSTYYADFGVRFKELT